MFVVVIGAVTVIEQAFAEGLLCAMSWTNCSIYIPHLILFTNPVTGYSMFPFYQCRNTGLNWLSNKCLARL